MTIGIDLRDADGATTGPVVVIGAGGLGQEVRDAVEASGRRFAGFLDDRSSAEVIGAVEPAAVPLGVWALLAVGDPVLRWELASRFCDFSRWAIVSHPSAVISQRACLGPGCYVGALAYVGPLAIVGCHAVVNVHAEVGHDAEVGTFGTLSPLCALNGNVKLGEGCFLGTGTTIEPGLSIGAWTRVAAASHVRESCGEGMLLIGSPAKGRRLYRAPADSTSARPVTA